VYQTVNWLRARGADPRLLGRPLGDTRVLLVAGDGADDFEVVLPGSGKDGEIWLAGTQVARGYLGAAAQTAARFVERAPHGRCFRTGDIGRAAPDGVKLLGRRDTQVKINGKRADVTEVENALVGGFMPGLVTAAAAVLRGGRLVAYCVPAAPAPPSGGAEARVLVDALRLASEQALFPPLPLPHPCAPCGSLSC